MFLTSIWTIDLYLLKAINRNTSVDRRPESKPVLNKDMTEQRLNKEIEKNIKIRNSLYNIQCKDPLNALAKEKYLQAIKKVKRLIRNNKYKFFRSSCG